MLLRNEFVVAADLDTVWRHLLDLENVAKCVPGARVEEVVLPATYRGTIRVKIGPLRVEYRGEATLGEVDDATHQATMRMKAREARGQGAALATVRSTLSAAPDGTHVSTETELDITGPQAQFGKGVLEDVGGRILEEFTARLERQIEGERASLPAETLPAETRPAETRDDALDLNRAIASSLRPRGARIVGALVAFAALLATWRRVCARRR